MSLTVELWTDGSSTGAVGDGGWAYVLRCGATVKEACGFQPDTTNNRMELTGLLMGLRALKREGVRVEVFTDSQYVMHPFTQGWLHKWRRAGWITGRGSKKRPVSNRDLWEAVSAEVAMHTVTFNWVKGHADILLNEKCDELAKLAKAARMDRYVEVELPTVESMTMEMA